MNVDILPDFWEKIEEKHLERIKSYYDCLPDDYILQHNMGFMWLMIGDYYIGEKNNFLFILNKKLLHSYMVLILNHFPIYKGKQDFNIIKNMVIELKNIGINCRLTDYEVDIFNNEKVNLIKNTMGEDIIYGKTELIITGKENKNKRYINNYFDKNYKLDVIEKENLINFKNELDDFVEKWLNNKIIGTKHKRKEFSYHLHKFIQYMNYAYEPQVLLIRKENELLAFSITERISNTSVHMSDIKSINTLFPFNRILHHNIIKIWNEKYPEIKFYNIGNGGGIKKLTEHKLNLHPEKLLEIYKFNIKPNKEIFDSIKIVKKLDNINTNYF